MGSILTDTAMDITLIALFAIGLIVANITFFWVAKNRMHQQFEALANDALLRNNQNFMELATTTLEKFQVEAKGDLALKHQAIQELVNPLQKELEKHEKQVAELERKREQLLRVENTENPDLRLGI